MTAVCPTDGGLPLHLARLTERSPLVLSPEEFQRLQNKLKPKEQLLWAGKPIPRAFTEFTTHAMLFSFLWWGFLCFVICTFFSDYDPNTNVYIFGVKKTASGFSAREIALFFVPLTPFIIAGIGLAFAPLWKYLIMKERVYVVTTKRAMIVGRIHTQSWRASEMQFIRRTSTDVHFVYSPVEHNGHHPPIGFESLSANDLDAAEAALHKLHPQKFPDPNEERKKYPYAYFR